MARQDNDRRRAVVIGGSMGGLFIGNMLVRQGWQVDIYERIAGALNVRGAGIAGHADYGPILRACGIAEDGLAGVDVAGRTAYDGDGREIAFHPHPQYLTYWGLLHGLLRRAFPDAHYHAGVGLVDLTPGEPRARLRLSDGRSVEADLVVGADGIRSSVRAILAPEIVPQYGGYFAFRGLTPEARLSDEFRRDMMHRYIWMFPGDGQLNGYPMAGPTIRWRPGIASMPISGTGRSAAPR